MSAEKTYPIAALLSKAEDCFVRFQHEAARKFYERALEAEPDNTQALDGLGELLLEMDLPEEAVTVLRKSVAIAPEMGASKYMNLGQLLSGTDALASYQKGVQLMSDELLRLEAQKDTDQEEAESIKSTLCSGFVSMAELYLTDLCFETNAETECQRLLDLAVARHPSVPEPYQSLASLRISQEQKKEALKFLRKSYSLWKEKDRAEWPSHEFRLTGAKLFLELQQNDLAAEVLEGVVEEQDENLDAWYLLGYAYWLVEDPGSAVECFTKVHMLAKRFPEQADDAIMQHVAELLPQAEAAAEGIPDDDEDDDDQEADADDQECDDDDDDDDDDEDGEDIPAFARGQDELEDDDEDEMNEGS